MKKQQTKNTLLKKENRSPEMYHKEVKVQKLLGTLFKIIVMKMFNNIRKTMHEQKENFNKKTENIKKTQQILELRNAETELKNLLRVEVNLIQQK